MPTRLDPRHVAFERRCQTHFLAYNPNLLVLLFCWNALKFIAIGPVSLALLARTRLREHLERRALRGSGISNAAGSL